MSCGGAPRRALDAVGIIGEILERARRCWIVVRDAGFIGRGGRGLAGLLRRFASERLAVGFRFLARLRGKRTG